MLEVGCAAGHLSALLAGRGADVVGVDVSEGLICLARKEFGALARFEVADIAQPLSFADSSFDSVTASLVLRYLADFGPTRFVRFARGVGFGGGRGDRLRISAVLRA